MQTELIQGDSRESAEEGDFPYIDIDRTYILLLIIDIRYNDKNHPRSAGADLNFLVVDYYCRIADVDAKKLTCSYNSGELNISC